LQRTIPLVRDGAKTLLELADAVVFALKRRPLELPDKITGMLTDETRGRLSRLKDRLGAEATWEVATLEGTLRNFAEAEGVGLGKIGPALRGVLSGGSPAPDLAGALVSLGKAESLGRIDDALSQPQ
jgi:glutamyl-tRNA synthetase